MSQSAIPEPGRIRRFLWFSAGAEADLLAKCPKSEWAKYEGMGGVVVATAVLAFLSGSYAFYTVFSPKSDTALAAVQQAVHWPSVLQAILAGAIWSLVIYNLDRFVVSSSGKGDGSEKITWDEWKSAFPRLLMAVAIGVTLSAPLEIKVMESEIESELAKVQAEYE